MLKGIYPIFLLGALRLGLRAAILGVKTVPVYLLHQIGRTVVMLARPWTRSATIRSCRTLSTAKLVVMTLFLVKEAVVIQSWNEPQLQRL